MGIPKTAQDALKRTVDLADTADTDGFAAKQPCVNAAARAELQEIAGYLATLCPNVPIDGENPLYLKGEHRRQPGATPVIKQDVELLFTDLVWDRGALVLVHRAGPNICLTNGRSAAGRYETWPVTRLLFTAPAAMDPICGYEGLDWLSRGSKVPRGAVAGAIVLASGHMYPVVWKGAQGWED